ncbi:hypothetical protein AWJ20_4113 [Sugiyamaella lignohabitans]|uniref:AAR2 C-terminal domain-containing protein n=1 Tax=Sugiyamaella lignohabitans TaxID=796027 RepID=A0A167C799_9ASCO|nr:uncharacterized protein AWJ20_4113 [Sugiyamaella lignohabitans]ANB11309.1 hypothetical protein AWJ20_4113 [Sugiyamaella lignohabitans]
MLINDEIGELNVSATKSRLGEMYSFMVPYPDPEGSNWPVLTDRITLRVAESVLPSTGIVTSSSTSKEENELLLKSLRDSAAARIAQETDLAQKKAGQEGSSSAGPIPSSVEEDRIIKSLVDQNTEELKFTELDLRKTWKTGATGRDVTLNSFDKSWYLNNTVKVFGDLLGELQLSYVLMVIFANFSGAQQWKKITELVLRCRSDVAVHPQRYIEFFNIVYHQIKACPVEYIDEFLEKSFLQKSFGHFRRLLVSSGTSQLEPALKIAPQVKAAADRVFDTLRVSGVPIPFLREGDEVDSEDEDDEDKPVVVG